jgi:hypothetical protein
MSAGATSAVAGWKDGITPAVQQNFDAAAGAVRQAIAAVDAAYLAAAEVTDAELRCEETLQFLKCALAALEWAPPAEH